jgi:DNA-binding NtrC family response regulator
VSLGTTILIVDDEKNTRSGLRQFLGSLDYDVLDTGDPNEAIGIVKRDRPEIVLTDLKMPDMDGLDLLASIKRARPRTIVILLTAYGTVESAVKAMKAGAFYYLTKPVNFDEVELTLKKALHQKHLEDENVSLRAELFQERHETSQIIGHSQSIKKMMALAKQAAQSNATVLIQGESGTGKELFAHLVHSKSKRAENVFVTVHMAALTETLLASELFGHERGAFTGATERKIGRFERASGGTLFLDEVSAIPEVMQSKLLRVIQSGEFERVGGTKTLHSDVRLVCASNRELQKEVTAGRFREDLYYRLNVILLEIPPLRERAADIPELARHFLAYFNGRNRKQIKEITPGAMNVLRAYSWPGNIRELKNIIERMVVLSNADAVDVDDLPQDLKGKRPASAGDGVNTTTQDTIQSMEAEMIRRALTKVNGNKSLAAKHLGISRRTLYRKIEEYKINE